MGAYKMSKEQKPKDDKKKMKQKKDKKKDCM